MHARVAVVAALVAAAAIPDAAAEKARPLPGFGGLTYRELTVKHGCRSQVRVVQRSRKVDDPELVTLLTWPRITGLDFDPADPDKQRTSLRRFHEWFRKLSDQGTKVSQRQAAIVTDRGRPAAMRLEAIARLVLAQEQVVHLIGGIEVPPSVRAIPEAADAYCDKMEEVIEPLEAKIEESRQYCQRLATETAAGPGWWTAVCGTAPTAATPPAQP